MDSKLPLPRACASAFSKNQAGDMKTQQIEIIMKDSFYDILLDAFSSQLPSAHESPTEAMVDTAIKANDAGPEEVHLCEEIVDNPLDA